jgi:polyhydroxyalkanoate synthesis regulator phasin
MTNFLKTGFLLGLGAAVSSKEKVDKYVDDLLAKGKVTPKEADELYSALLKKGEETEEQWNHRTKEKMSSVMEDLNIISRNEFLALQHRVEELEKTLSEIQKEESTNKESE